MNDLGPSLFTSVVMKILERFILEFLKSLVNTFTDPIQFAYSKGRNTEDAILLALEKIYCHFEHQSRNVSARVMFFDFSSAFNTIQPHLLGAKLSTINLVPHSLIHWILNYLTHRPQYVECKLTL